MLLIKFIIYICICNSYFLSYSLKGSSFINGLSFLGGTECE
uniref:Uncharacterized protein n=1 Tax=Arundo donax TaxID=35708 RepID=A0A0A9C6R4_ARUDO